MSTETATFDSTLPVLKTVKLGLFRTPDEYREALKGAERQVDEWADEILNKLTFPQVETEVDLVVLSAPDLGFKSLPKYRSILARAVQRGLKLCPAEVGPALRLQYHDQPESDMLLIAMELIMDMDGDNGSIFRVQEEDGKFMLRCFNVAPDDVWWSEHRFVFVRPRHR